MRLQISSLLVCRDQADADIDASRSDRAVTVRRTGELTTIGGHLQVLGQHTTDQQQQVTTTGQANQQQQQRQTETGSGIESSASRLAGLATLEALLGGWAAVTGTAAKAIGLVSASGAAKINQVNADARRFMGQLTQAKLLVSGQQSQHPLMMGRLTGNAATIQGEGGRATGILGQVDQSRLRVVAMQEQNQRDATAAETAEERAARDARLAAETADQTQARHDQLAADLQAWAQRHAEQRRFAVTQTADKLTAKGFEVLDAPTW
jgi:hypothetical protein